MSKKLKPEDIIEQIVYIWTCPFCFHVNEYSEDPLLVEGLYCSGCDEDIEIDNSTADKREKNIINRFEEKT